MFLNLVDKIKIDNENLIIVHNYSMYNVQKLELPLNMNYEMKTKILQSLKQDNYNSSYLSSKLNIKTKEISNEDEDSLNNSTTMSNNSSDKQGFSLSTKFKTEICKFWEMNNNCKYKENCSFAHGNDELKQKYIQALNYKTKKCKQFFDSGYCSYGTRCQFVHHESKIAKKYFSYKKVISEINDPNNCNIEVVRRPRLKTFENLAKSKSDANHDCLVREIQKIKLNSTF